MSGVDFSVILASTVHDTKNSLGLLLQSLDELISEAGLLTPEQTRRFSVIHYEASRVNNDLIQMLGLFKLNQSQLPLNMNWHPVLDFLEDQLLRYATLLDTRGIRHDIECDDLLNGYFDADLVAGILNNVITNSIRYTETRILVRGALSDGMLMLEIADDGRGYPESMLNHQGNYLKSINFSSGSTGLGLYFAEQIAQLHQQDDRRGYIRLENGGSLGGGVFRVYLP